MTRWARTNLALGALGAVLLMLDLWPQASPSAAGTLTGLTPDQIRTIRVERDRRLTLALARDGAGGPWKLTHPQQRPADPRRVGKLLAIAAAPVSFRHPLDDDAGRYGLTEPAAVLLVNGQRLAFGDRDPTQQGRYVQVDDEVCLIDDLFFNLLTLPAGHFAAD